jgi:lambda repressor-like predicted transcriptional regulator
MSTTAPTNAKWTKVLTKRFLVTQLKAGRTAREIADEVGCSENTLRDHLVRHGLLAVSGVPKSVVADYTRLRSVTAVADEHRVAFSTARRWLLASGVTLNEAHRPESAVFDITTAARRYEQGESLASIAADVDVAVNTLKRRLEVNGVTMRSRGPRHSPAR